MSEDFGEALRRELNTHGRENGSNTPDRILASFMLGCLETFDAATRSREKWYGVELVPGRSDPRDAEIARLKAELAEWTSQASLIGKQNLVSAFGAACARAEAAEAENVRLETVVRRANARHAEDTAEARRLREAVEPIRVLDLRDMQREHLDQITARVRAALASPPPEEP